MLSKLVYLDIKGFILLKDIYENKLYIIHYHSYIGKL